MGDLNNKMLYCLETNREYTLMQMTFFLNDIVTRENCESQMI
jgi:hypothetical protein